MLLDFMEVNFILSVRYTVEEDPVPDGDVGWEWFYSLIFGISTQKWSFQCLKLPVYTI